MTVLSRVYQFKYLGVVLDPCLSWNNHVDYIGRKVSARLGMLRRARKVISREPCITLYNAMVLPIFDYCATIWDSCGRTNRHYLDKLHRRGASIIEGNIVSQPQIAQVFSWPSLQSRRDYLKCMLVFKCLHNLAPPYMLFHHSREFHDYNTRHRDLLRPPFAKTSKATFTRDQSGTVPNRTGPDRLLFTWNCLEPVQVFTRDLSGTGPDRIRYWTCKTAGPVLDPFRTGSRTVPCKQKAYPVRKSDRIRSGPVPCKHSLSIRAPSGLAELKYGTASR